MTKDAVFKILLSETRSEEDKSALKSKNPKTVGIRVWWDFEKSPRISEGQRSMIARMLKNRIAQNGVLMVSYKKQPTKIKNRREAILIMTRLVAHALKEGKSRFKRTK